jgi:hypothetical protein
MARSFCTHADMNKFIAPTIILLVLLGGGAWYFFGSNDVEKQPVDAPELFFAQNSAAQEPIKIEPPTVPEGWRKFENEQYGFSVYMPPELTANVYDEGGGAHTFTFEDADGGKGFQIFVLPYSESTISEERFLKDSPAGVMKEPVDVTIGGVRATAFFGEHMLMGETREVWFLHNNLLYEVTTYKHLDTWLADIMKTWRFAR